MTVAAGHIKKLLGNVGNYTELSKSVAYELAKRDSDSYPINLPGFNKAFVKLVFAPTDITMSGLYKADTSAYEYSVVLPQPHKGQKEILDNAQRYNVVSCGRRFGKTNLGKLALIRPALEGYPVAWFAPKYKHLHEVWDSIKRMTEPVTRYTNSNQLRIELITGGVVEFWSLENRDAGLSRAYKCVVIDEASRVSWLHKAWNENIRPTLTDYEGDAWFLSTPRLRNYFFTLWSNGLESENDWECWQKTTLENPHIPPGEVEAAKDSMPHDLFRQEYLAEFLENQGSVFRSLEGSLYEPQDVTPDDHEGHTLVAGIDWGRKNDFTAISVMCRDCLVEVDTVRFNKIEYSYQVTRLAEVLEKWKVSIIVPESNAMGDPLIDFLETELAEMTSQDFQVLPFFTNSIKKTHIIQELAICLEKNEAQWIDNPDWTNELMAYEISLSSSGRVTYGAPPGMHDDTVMARALSWHGVGGQNDVLLFSF